MGQYDFVLDGGSPPRSSSKASQRSSSEISGLADALDGFRLGTSCSLLKKKFPAPVLPRNWKPSTVGRIRTSRFEEEDDIKRKPAPTSGKSTNPTRYRQDTWVKNIKNCLDERKRTTRSRLTQICQMKKWGTTKGGVVL